ncbi:hypothetical protein BV25DRAFT_641384 [Artomyces pyxidatus]|uniref:Uncharacterized protein n=1 Tax=Artomyces pyxidatus TaxID=48021 RepID=A0ACB8T2C3_9AGAM|nr:hypothetical protein BV25DRAFT_641384 [Artomyces pyxidatus]
MYRSSWTTRPNCLTYSESRTQQGKTDCAVTTGPADTELLGWVNKAQMDARDLGSCHKPWIRFNKATRRRSHVQDGHMHRADGPCPDGGGCLRVGASWRIGHFAVSRWRSRVCGINIWAYYLLNAQISHETSLNEVTLRGEKLRSEHIEPTSVDSRLANLADFTTPGESTVSLRSATLAMAADLRS